MLNDVSLKSFAKQLIDFHDIVQKYNVKRFLGSCSVLARLKLANVSFGDKSTPSKAACVF